MAYAVSTHLRSSSKRVTSLSEKTRWKTCGSAPSRVSAAGFRFRASSRRSRWSALPPGSSPGACLLPLRSHRLVQAAPSCRIQPLARLPGLLRLLLTSPRPPEAVAGPLLRSSGETRRTGWSHKPAATWHRPTAGSISRPLQTTWRPSAVAPLRRCASLAQGIAAVRTHRGISRTAILRLVSDFAAAELSLDLVA